MLQKSQKLNLVNVIMVFDVTSLYHSAMWEEKSVHAKKENGLAFKPRMSDVYIKPFNNQTFNQDGAESAKLKLNF